MLVGPQATALFQCMREHHERFTLAQMDGDIVALRKHDMVAVVAFAFPSMGTRVCETHAYVFDGCDPVISAFIHTVLAPDEATFEQVAGIFEEALRRH